MTDVLQLNRTLEQELLALARGASLECLVCGEFVLHAPDGSIRCPQCESHFSALVGRQTAGTGRAAESGAG